MRFDQSQAIYLQIADHVCEKILLKEWEEGMRIPSVREMAVSIEVNPNTVIRAYSYLEEQGIIFKRRGLGYFIHDAASKKVLELKKAIFFNQDVPSFFKTLQLLGISFEDIKEHYGRYHSHQDGK